MKETASGLCCAQLAPKVTETKHKADLIGVDIFGMWHKGRRALMFSVFQAVTTGRAQRIDKAQKRQKLGDWTALVK